MVMMLRPLLTFLPGVDLKVEIRSRRRVVLLDGADGYT